MPLLLAVMLVALLVGMETRHAESGTESGFIKRFAGTWVGGGHIQKNAESNVWQVSCRVNAEPDDNRISIDGTCNAAMVVSSRIGADLIYNPATGRYSGTYTGASIGPAALSGSRNGNAVRLTITWPAPVNGDNQAHLTVQNDGQGSLRIFIADNLEPGGPIQTTSEIVFSQ